jgi:hypothetical protein
VDDPEHEDHSVLGDDVVHHSHVSDAQAMAGVAGSAERLDSFAGDPPGLSRVDRQLFQRVSDPTSFAVWQLRVRLDRRRREADLVTGQSRS